MKLLVLNAAESTELDAISKYSEVVPDTVIFDDFERYRIAIIFFPGSKFIADDLDLRLRVSVTCDMLQRGSIFLVHMA